jgi:hypothetical protein
MSKHEPMNLSKHMVFACYINTRSSSHVGGNIRDCELSQHIQELEEEFQVGEGVGEAEDPSGKDLAEIQFHE